MRYNHEVPHKYLVLTNTFCLRHNTPPQSCANKKVCFQHNLQILRPYTCWNEFSAMPWDFELSSIVYTIYKRVKHTLNRKTRKCKHRESMYITRSSTNLHNAHFFIYWGRYFIPEFNSFYICFPIRLFLLCHPDQQYFLWV